MDPMSLITAGMGALASIFGAVGGVADLVKSVAGLFTEICNNLTSQVGQSQEDQAVTSAKASTEGLTQEQSEAVTSPVYNIFSGSQLNSSQLSLAA